MSTKSNVKHPSLYEVNTRVLLSRYKTDQKRATLKDIPDTFWQELAVRGINWVWLMGVWTLKEKEVEPNLIPDHMMSDFKTLIPDLTYDDIDGSTYAIDDYTVDPVIGGEEELAAVRKKLDALGIKLMLDFVPNHYGANTHWLRTHPEYFIEVGESIYNINTSTFYTPKASHNKYFAHGKDPYFDAWGDTVQVDYTFDGTREWMTKQLLHVGSLCDGMRCDMAMLPVKDVFTKTWGDYVKWNGDEFWPEAIRQLKEEYPDAIVLAEVYWDMEAKLLEMGFDYCYDKIFHDRLTSKEALKAHFNADIWFLERTARFLENHDEERIAPKLHLRKHMAAAAMIAFGPGMRFWHMGQWEGHNKRIPVQVNREPIESCACLVCNNSEGKCECISNFYAHLIELGNKDILRFGDWSRIEIDEKEFPLLFLWKWTFEEKELIVAINYSKLEYSLKRDMLAFSNDQFEQVFPTFKDAYGRLEMHAWDVRVWGN